MSPQRPEPSEVEAARLVLARMGVAPEDLLDATPRPSIAPTFADYIPTVSAAVSTGTRRVYASYWKRITAHWGDRRLDEPTPSEIQHLAEQIREQVVPRRNARGGRSAAEHLIAALRCIYHHAIADGLLDESTNPAQKTPKPRRLPTTRRGLPDSGMTEINHIAATTGNDPALDTLLLRLHTETACRRGGALALRTGDLDPHQCLILLREKADTTRWQPVSPTLMQHLQDHAHQRDSIDSGHLLRYQNGKPLTYRRYDHLWHRIGTHLPWVATQQISTHWLRHTTLTWVERHYGYATAHAYAYAYAGHTDNTTGNTGTTTTYIRAGLDEIATALAALTGEPHPSPQTQRPHNPEWTVPACADSRE